MVRISVMGGGAVHFSHLSLLRHGNGIRLLFIVYCRAQSQEAMLRNELRRTLVIIYIIPSQ